MASDRGSATELEPDELEPAWFACDALHLSGYALLARAGRLGRRPRGRARARCRRARVSVDLSSWSLIDEPFRERVRALRARARVRDRARAGGLRPARRPRGSSSAAPRALAVDGVDHPALPTEVVDPTGAGDAFAAGYLVGGVELGLEAAARCCAKLGAMP